MTSKKEFWDLDESKDFTSILASDGNIYKVLKYGSPEENQQAAEILSRIRKDINGILIYIYNNPQLWNNKPIAFGIFHTFDIHLPELSNLPDRKLFNYQEMTPNSYGIIGLNKPKKIITIPVEMNGRQINYEIADKRSIFLTLRNGRRFNNYSTILDLAIHELTHTTCNDVRWKKDNHLPPYQSYHTLIRKWAKEAKILT